MKHSHYHKDVSRLQMIDVYRVLALYAVTDPCIQHAVKKLLVAGGRGAGKDISQDIQEAIDSLERWKDMREEDKNPPTTVCGVPYIVVEEPDLLTAPAICHNLDDVMAKTAEGKPYVFITGAFYQELLKGPYL